MLCPRPKCSNLCEMGAPSHVHGHGKHLLILLSGEMVHFTPRLSVPHSLTVKPPASANILRRVARCPQEWIHTPLNNLKRHIRPTRAAQSLSQRTRFLSFTDILTSSLQPQHPRLYKYRPRARINMGPCNCRQVRLSACYSRRDSLERRSR